MVATLGGEHAELLSEVELFRGLDRITLAKLAAHLEPLALTAGEILLRQGDRPDGLYLVSRGTFAIYAGGGRRLGWRDPVQHLRARRIVWRNRAPDE
jgi:hypothetical protein